MTSSSERFWLLLEQVKNYHPAPLLPQYMTLNGFATPTFSHTDREVPSINIAFAVFEFCLFQTIQSSTVSLLKQEKAIASRCEFSDLLTNAIAFSIKCIFRKNRKLDLWKTLLKTSKSQLRNWYRCQSFVVLEKYLFWIIWCTNL